MAAVLLVWRWDWNTEDPSTTWHLPLAGKVIVLDPGHGGIDGGASSKTGLLEKEVTLDVALHLRDYLQEAGALVLMTREEDVDLAEEGTKKIRQRKTEDLRNRLAVVNESDADLFLTLHMNAIPAQKWHGAQTFYHLTNPKNEALAVFIQEELRRNLENTNRYAKPIHHVFLLKEANIPGALVEAGFLSNPTEAELLETDEYKQKVAASIYEGIMRFYSGEEAPPTNQ
ncbi:N-acetylmuramoyl-L-alanine amidase CwlD [Shouchella shacheensis]|uniref:N-acetylmuramoyl-L-alanine amidase CwlD n=1 Tax=Shouchella shacheensis TaxID=1649580 RepID=UPI00073FB6C0|nr:N-acetylmuramoyl-L-alanine amidase CwlD [Shouchella shacheensis]